MINYVPKRDGTLCSRLPLDPWDTLVWTLPTKLQVQLQATTYGTTYKYVAGRLCKQISLQCRGMAYAGPRAGAHVLDARPVS